MKDGCRNTAVGRDFVLLEMKKMMSLANSSLVQQASSCLAGF